MKLITYHGTSEKNAKKIMKEGFKTDINHNWKVKSKKGFVYFSDAYAPFYAGMNKGNSNKLAIIKVEIDYKDLYPEDDFLMRYLNKPVYTQEELGSVSFSKYKYLWPLSLRSMGNVAARPDKIKILGITCFDGNKLLMKCDPVISPMNYQILGNYYRKLTEMIFNKEDWLNLNMVDELNG